VKSNPSPSDGILPSHPCVIDDDTQAASHRFLSPRGPLYRHRGGIWKKTMRYAPLTLTTLAALIPQEIQRHSDHRRGRRRIDPDRIEADLVGISRDHRPRLARTRSRRASDPEGSRRPWRRASHVDAREAMHHAESIVVGYARIVAALLRRFRRRAHGASLYQSPHLKLANLPFRGATCFPRMVNVAHTLEATRGCIYQCEFCVVPAAWGGRCRSLWPTSWRTSGRCGEASIFLISI